MLKQPKKREVIKMKKWAILLLISLMTIVIAACGSTESTASSDGSKGKVVIGGKDFTEQILLSKITSVYLQEHGYDVEEANNMGSSVVRSALENGQIDMYWEYTGTGLVIYQGHEPESDPEKTFQIVKETDKAEGLVWLDQSSINNTYALLMREELASELGIHTLSDLANHIKNVDDSLKFGSNAEFYAREDGIKGLEQHYGFEFPSKNVVRMDSGLLYDALKDGQVDVSVGFATDGRIKGFELVGLEDDQLFFPAYFAAPVLREEIYTEELAELISKLAAALNDEVMTQLNYNVDIEHQNVKEVSEKWLKEQGLID
jgi:osmoprotectant transport system substrate-binding protein